MKKNIIYGTIVAIGIAMIFFIYFYPMLYNVGPIEEYDKATESFEIVDADSNIKK